MCAFVCVFNQLACYYKAMQHKVDYEFNVEDGVGDGVIFDWLIKLNVMMTTCYCTSCKSCASFLLHLTGKKHLLLSDRLKSSVAMVCCAFFFFVVWFLVKKWLRMVLMLRYAMYRYICVYKRPPTNASIQTVTVWTPTGWCTVLRNRQFIHFIFSFRTRSARSSHSPIHHVAYNGCT